MQEARGLDPASIRSYRDFRRAVRGLTAVDLRELYDTLYYSKHVGNAELAALYFESEGLAPTEYTQKPLELAKIQPGDRILDVGCGRGEIVFQAAQQGAVATGIDFSPSAIEIARETSGRLPEDVRARSALFCGSGSAMPFESSSFDTVFMLDVAEHLSQGEFDAVLVEVMRVLVGNGRLIVHTTPNRWARTYGFWVRSVAVRMAGRPAPVHPLVAQLRQLEEDPEYDARTCFLHINEQSPLSLKGSLRRAGFRSRVWLEHSANPWLGRPQAGARVLRATYDTLGLRFLFGSGLFAVASPATHSKRAA